MDTFIKCLSIEQLEKLKSLIDTELHIKKSESREHIRKEYEDSKYNRNELNSLRRKYKEHYHYAPNHKEAEIMEFHLQCINTELQKLKNKLLTN